jgi:transposase
MTDGSNLPLSRGRPFRMEWRDQDDANRLARAYRAERNAELRQRLHALWLLRQGQRMAHVASTLGVHYTTIHQWVAWYRQGGIEEVRRHRRGGRQGRVARLSIEQQAAFAAQAASGAFRTAQQAQAWLHTHFGVEYSRPGIYHLLHRSRWKKKLPRPMGAQASEEAQLAWKRGDC